MTFDTAELFHWLYVISMHGREFTNSAGVREFTLNFRRAQPNVNFIKEIGPNFVGSAFINTASPYVEVQGNSNYMLWQCTGFEGSNFIEIYALYTGISISYLHSGLWVYNRDFPVL